MTGVTDVLNSAQSAVDALDKASARFGQTLTDAFVKAGNQGKSFESILQSVGARLAELAARDFLPSTSQSLVKGLSSFSGTMSAFAEGGIISAPTYFPTGPSSMGLAGEAGPEAILPLSRGPDGKLGVSGSRPTIVNVTITTQDLDSFKRSEQQVAAALARAVHRGRRSL